MERLAFYLTTPIKSTYPAGMEYEPGRVYHVFNLNEFGHSNLGSDEFK